MAETAAFQSWLRIETARRLGKLKNIDEEIERQMRDGNLKVEGKEDGKWTPLS